MSKKSAAKKRKPQKKKVSLPPAQPKADNDVQVYIGDATRYLNITFLQENGEEKEVRDTVTRLHRLALTAQNDAMLANNDPSEYEPFLAKRLKNKYGVEVSEDQAYEAAVYIFEMFGSKKKN